MRSCVRSHEQHQYPNILSMTTRTLTIYLSIPLLLKVFGLYCAFNVFLNLFQNFINLLGIHFRPVSEWCPQNLGRMATKYSFSWNKEPWLHTVNQTCCNKNKTNLVRVPWSINSQGRTTT